MAQLVIRIVFKRNTIHRTPFRVLLCNSLLGHTLELQFLSWSHLDDQNRMSFIYKGVCWESNEKIPLLVSRTLISKQRPHCPYSITTKQNGLAAALPSDTGFTLSSLLIRSKLVICLVLSIVGSFMS